MSVLPARRLAPGVITVVSDTHGTDGHRLAGRTLTAVREAELVIHAGDFTTETVLDAFRDEAGRDARDGAVGEDGDGRRATERDASGRALGKGVDEGRDANGDAGGDDRDGATGFVAVAGNNDDAGVRGRLASTAVVERAGVRFAVVHGHEHDETALGLLGRQEGADVVVVGHSHRPRWERTGAGAVLNPGSHADPRWNRPAHAELEPTTEGLCGRLVTPNGEVLEAFTFAVGDRA